MKTCSRCRRSLALSMFHKDSTKVDGLYTVCKECRKGVTAKPVIPSGWRLCKVCGEAKPEIGFYKASGNATRRTCISCCEKKWKKSYKNRTGRIGNGIKNLFGLLSDASQTLLRRSNPLVRKKARAADKKYKESVKGKEHRERWVESNRPRFPIYNAVRKTKSAGLPASLTVDDWKKILNAFENKCVYCGKTDCVFSKDHYIPLSKGGGFFVGNVVPACKNCNSKKKDKLPSAFVSKEKRVEIEKILRSLYTA